MSTAPWWATGVFTLSGVVLAQLVAWVLSRSRATFEDSRRWHEDRRDIYLDVVTNAWRIQDAVFDHFELAVELPDELETFQKDLDAASVKTQLVGSEEVMKVTRELVTHGCHCRHPGSCGARRRRSRRMRCHPTHALLLH
jgi:hypothetical protein